MNCSVASWAFPQLIFNLVRALFCCCFVLLDGVCRGQDRAPCVLVFHSISIELDSTGIHDLTSDEIAAISAGSTSSLNVNNLRVTPSRFSFCDVGVKQVELSMTDSRGDITNCTGPILINAPKNAPETVYVDSKYAASCNGVPFPNGTTGQVHWIGFDAFPSIQAAVNRVADNGTVYVAPGRYVENVVISKPLSLLGPNVGTFGDAGNRRAEAMVSPAQSDPENSPIISVESDEVLIDGFFLDGSNSELPGGYNANGVRVHAAAGVQNGSYPDLADIEGVIVRNNIITNISYDGICFDRFPYFGSSSAWNYILQNKLVNMWEGILTYALDSVIADNVISNVTHGLSVHCVTTPSPEGFLPLVAGNHLTIAQWWPLEIRADRAPGIWINFRREEASPIEVVGNVINTPAPTPPSKTVIGLYALTVDGNGKIKFVNNTVNGLGNCTVGLFATSCWSNDAVELSGGVLKGVHGYGVLAHTLDPKWGNGNSCVTISNVDIQLNPGAVGISVVQDPTSPGNESMVSVVANTKISGGSYGVQISGTNAGASLVGNAQPICNNNIGIYVNGGRALIEGNILTNNRIAAIMVEHDGIVDAGDCSGLNLTGLRTGTGMNGSSSGLNDLSGYGFDQVEPWAIQNFGSVAVSCDNNLFNAKPDEEVLNAIKGPVQLSPRGNLKIVAPPSLSLECFKEIPAAAQTVEEFVAAGGSVASGAQPMVTSHDLILTNRPGHYTLTRTYTFSAGCGQQLACQQVISVQDNHPPVLVCTPSIVQGVDPGFDFATVTFTNVATDSCGELLGGWEPITTSQFELGTNRIIMIATDAANNSSACSFEVVITRLPVILTQPVSRTNSVGTSASFNVVLSGAAPLSFRWRKDGIPLTDSKSISGSSTAELTLRNVSELDAADYSVDVTNPEGSAVSSSARLTVVEPAWSFLLLGVSRGIVSLSLEGPPDRLMGIYTSTNLINWSGLYTNRAPFLLLHTNGPEGNVRFYRARHVP